MNEPQQVPVSREVHMDQAGFFPSLDVTVGQRTTRDLMLSHMPPLDWNLHHPSEKEEGGRVNPKMTEKALQ